MFFRQKNLLDTSVEQLPDPWNVKVPQEVLDLPKAKYKARWRDPTTEHWLLSLAEGANPRVCVSADNPAAVLHGFMADYDGVLTDDLLEAVRKRPMNFRPAWWCKSHSGQLHLVWLFERPIAVTGNVHANELLHVVALKVAAVKLGVGYDTDSEKVTQVMDIGREWHSFDPDAVIPAEQLVLWSTALFESGSKKFHPEATRAIPFDKISARVHELYPSAPRDFREGLRCRRFWDVTADNPTACLVRPEGIVVFTPHDGGFKSWPSLLGNDFCEQFIASNLAPFYEDTFYVPDRDAYIRFFRHGNPRGTAPKFEPRSLTALRRDIIKETGLSDKKPKGGELSEVDNALWTICSTNSVTAAAKVVFRPAGKLDTGMGTYILNTSLVTALKPAPEPRHTIDEITALNVPEKYRQLPDTCAWDNPLAVAGFPNIYRFLTTLFLPNEHVRRTWEEAGYPVQMPQSPTAAAQITCLISWLSHFYRNAAKMTSAKRCGQALVLAGDAGRGKSFFARVLLGKLMGGVVDADKFYLDGVRFNDSLFDAPVHLIDDRLGAADRRLRAKFTEQLKVVVANAELRYEKKFGDSRESVPWAGRVVILCNKDPQALSVLPDLDMSTRDKFMMLMLGSAQFPFGHRPEYTMAWLEAELPAFARFLLGWRIPEDMADDRFGVQAWQHDDMVQASAENGLTQSVIESISALFESLTKGDEGKLDKGIAWTGTAGALWKALQDDDPNIRFHIYTRQCLAQNLGILQRSGYPISVDRTVCPAVWTIPYNFNQRMKQSETVLGDF